MLCAEFAAASGFQVAGSAGAAFEKDAPSDDADYKPGEESEFDSSESQDDDEAAQVCLSTASSFVSPVLSSALELRSILFFRSVQVLATTKMCPECSHTGY